MSAKETQDVETFITESTIGVIKNCISDDSGTSVNDNNSTTQEIGPNLVTFGLVPSNSNVEDDNTETIQEEDVEIQLDGLDEDEIDSYIMSADEAKYKDGIWNKINATYLEEQKVKQEKLAKEKEEGKTEKRKKKSGQRKKQTGPANSAGEAIEKMLQEKRLSSKINYDALKSLNIKTENKPTTETTSDNDNFAIPKPPPEKRLTSTTLEPKHTPSSKRKTQESNDTNNIDNNVTNEDITTTVKKQKTETENENNDSNPPATPTPSGLEDEDLDEYYDEEQPSTSTEIGMFQMLKNYRGDEGDGDEFENYGGFDEGYDEEY